jgi:putative transposase
VELNPVRAGLVKRPEAWRWSSADAHVKGKDDILVQPQPLLDLVKSPWKQYLSVDALEHEWRLNNLNMTTDV